jgi:hypothetical protein
MSLLNRGRRGLALQRGACAHYVRARLVVSGLPLDTAGIGCLRERVDLVGIAPQHSQHHVPVPHEDSLLPGVALTRAGHDFARCRDFP